MLLAVFLLVRCRVNGRVFREVWSFDLTLAEPRGWPAHRTQVITVDPVDAERLPLCHRLVEVVVADWLGHDL